MRERALILGAVATDDRVVERWDALRRHFTDVNEPMDYVLYSTYDRLTDALLSGQVDVAWNSPVAHVRVSRRSHGAAVGLLVRDRDRDLRSVWITRRESGINLAVGLVGKKLGVGGRDHAFSRLVPLEALHERGVDLTTVRLLVFDDEPGRHGAGERDEVAIFAAVRDGSVAAGAVSEALWQRLDPDRDLVMITQSSPCGGWVFDALPTLPTSLRAAFTRALGVLNPVEPGGAAVLGLFGAEAFAPVHEASYDLLKRAMDHQTAW